MTNALPTCSSGACTFVCSNGTGDCDSDAGNGCETSLATRVTHCGRCGNDCAAVSNGTPTCASGACGVACTAGFGNCDGNVTNGCEVVTTTSTAHCGGCGMACSTGQRCVAGRCEAVPPCPAGMRLIPAGEFDMGDENLTSDERPVHRVRLSAFCIDESEVTVAAYAQCPPASGCTTPAAIAGCNWEGSGAIAGREQHPINCVDWNQAAAYCRFRGGALPAETQWEYAARGSDGRIYPWGSTPVPSSQLWWSGGGTLRTSTCAVRGFPMGNSAFGLFDMVGDVTEWTADWHGPYPPNSGPPGVDPTGPISGPGRVVRGGAWNNAGEYIVRATTRLASSPTASASAVGFRCVRAAM